MEYKEFKNRLYKKFENNVDFYQRILSKMIFNPEMYAGLFRFNNVKNRLDEILKINYELKFIELIDEILAEKLQKNGYKILDYDFGRTIKIFETPKNEIYIIDFRMREDSGLSARKFMIDNIMKAGNELHNIFGDQKVKMIMLFAAEFNKNLEESIYGFFPFYKSSYEAVSIFYGSGLFYEIGMKKEWDNLVYNLEKLKDDDYYISSRNIPNFNDDEIILKTLLEMPSRPWNRLVLEVDDYADADSKFQLLQLIKKELFKAGGNLDKAKKIRPKVKKRA